MIQAVTWPPIAAAPDAAEHEFPGLTSSSILLQLNWGPIVQMLFVPLAAALVSGRNGLRRCVLVGLALAAACAAVRVIAGALPASMRRTLGSRLLLHLAAMLTGASAGFLQGLPSRFSAVWFPPHQRARATSCAFVGLGLGQAVCYAATPVLVARVDQLERMLVFQLVLAVPPVICCALHFPDKPERIEWHEAAPAPCTAATAAAERPVVHASVWQLVMNVLGNPSACLVAMVCGLANGPYQGWAAALPTIWEHLHYTSTQTDVLSFGSLAAYTAGCYVVGEFADRLFRGHLKRLLSLLVFGAIASFVWLCLMLPTPFQSEPVLHAGFGPVVVAVSLTGWFVGATNPICMELCAELTHPTHEAISGNVMIFFTQVFTVIALFVAPVMDPLATTPVMGAIILLCALLLLPVRERYLRSAAEGSLGHALTS
eukprot:NODE_7052_length_1613_cov_11.484522.p1 GENE.NODE_7052_length_1613_cov_11.484522~~NODE_7052_length_1613_cov_11.484522.p1  ORF type:complete len:429 (-),score=85.64 NODE_7052_length_1613_cov_11.484522:202-1488(-)